MILVLIFFHVFFVFGSDEHFEFTGHSCVHDDVVIKNPLEISLNEANLRREDYELVPLKFHFDTSYLKRDLAQIDHVDVDPELIDQMIDFFETDILENANEVFGKTMYVPNLRDKLQIPGEPFECFRNLPSDLLGKDYKNDLQSDYVVIINSVPSDYCGIAIAFSSPCMRVQEYRPILGMINLCPQYINLLKMVVSDSLRLKTQLYYYIVKQVIVHELFHDLGFSSDYFKEFDGGNVKEEMYRKQNRMFYSHEVSDEKIKEHFGCDDIKGAELENMEQKGTYRSHLDSRVYYTELMDGSGALELYLSPISFSILESSGWYIVDYYEIPNDFQFGKDEGCKFHTDDCVGGEDKKNPVPVSSDFCVSPTESRCLNNREGISSCKIIHYNSTNQTLETWEQYFEDPELGGLKSTDGCPVYFVTGVCQQYASEDKPFPSGWKASEVVRKCVETNQIVPSCTWMRCDFREHVVEVFDPFLEFAVECKEEGTWKNGESFECPPFEKVCVRGKVGVHDFTTEHGILEKVGLAVVYFSIWIFLGCFCGVCLSLFGIIVFLIFVRSTPKRKEDEDSSSDDEDDDDRSSLDDDDVEDFFELSSFDEITTTDSSDSDL